MDYLSILSTIITPIKNLHSWILRKCGKKIVDLGEYQEEIVEVTMDYVESSPNCIEERKQGAKFVWSSYPSDPKFEKYYETRKNTRVYFKLHDCQFLWIKRS